MNAASGIAPVITAGNESLKRDFPLKPFAIKHKLAGHPLLTLSRIAQLAADLPRDLIEYSSGDADISQDPDKVKGVDLDPVEVVNRIQTAGAWMVLKRIEKSPEYRALLEDALTSVAPRARLQNRQGRRLRTDRRLHVRVVAEFDHAVPHGCRGQFLRADPRRKDFRGL